MRIYQWFLRQPHLAAFDRAVQRLTGELGGKDRSVIELTGVYHNLLRLWADS